jgi:hypothetical protein
MTAERSLFLMLKTATPPQPIESAHGGRNSGFLCQKRRRAAMAERAWRAATPAQQKAIVTF